MYQYRYSVLTVTACNWDWDVEQLKCIALTDNKCHETITDWARS